MSARIAILGGGTTGLYAASALSHHRVTVFEPAAGKFESAAPVIMGVAPSLPVHAGLRDGWVSQWGGTSKIWGGQLLPWESWEIDGSVGEAWPLSYRELERGYRRVISRLGLQPTHARVHAGGTILEPTDSDAVRVRRSSWMTKTQRDFSRNRTLKKSLTPIMKTRAVVIDVEPRRSGFTVTARTQDGRITRSSFDQVVFAAGVIGNSRLIQNIASDPSNVGVGFMDHLSTRYAKMRVVDWQKFRDVGSQRKIHGVRTSPKYIVRPEALKSLGSLAGYGHWEFSLEQSLLFGGSSVSGISGNLKKTAQEGVETLRELTASRLVHRRPLPRYASVYLRVDIEQKPHVDRYVHWDGRPADQFTAKWDVSADEILSMRTLGGLIAQYLQSSNIGVEVEELTDIAPVDTKHMMGGTRMGSDPTTSVVSACGQVHGTSGAWVIGSSVFPTGGIANPTYTALALAERTFEAIG